MAPRSPFLPLTVEDVHAVIEGPILLAQKSGVRRGGLVQLLYWPSTFGFEVIKITDSVGESTLFTHFPAADTSRDAATRAAVHKYNELTGRI